MSSETTGIIPIAVDRAIAISAAICLGYWGYKLFCKNIFGDAGSMEAHGHEWKFALKKAAPGTFFAVCSAVVLMARF